MDQPDYEFGEFALQPGSTVHEALDAAGFDCHLPEQGAPEQDDRDGGF